MKVTLKSNLPLRKIIVGTLAGIIAGGVIGWIEESLYVNVPAGVAAILAVVVSFWTSYCTPLFSQELVTFEPKKVERIARYEHRGVVEKEKEMVDEHYAV